MAVNRTKVQFVYGIGDNLIQVPPEPIIAQRAPTSSDIAQLGTVWIDVPSSAPYWLTHVAAGAATWTGTSAGTGTFTAVTVNPGDVDVTAGDVNVALGDINVTAGSVAIGANLTVAGTTTLNGDIDITTAALFDITSTLDAAPSILLEANGGTSEQIEIYSNQGTATDSVYIHSDVGGLTLLAAGNATNDAINLTALAGGIDIDGALQVNIASSQNAASALVLSSSAGGIDITAAGTAGEDIDISNTASVNISSSEAVADAITITASNAAGGITLDAGTNGIEIGNSATCSVLDLGDFAPTASRLVTIAGGTVVTASVTDQVDIAPDGATTNADSIKQVNICSGNVTTGQSNVNINSGTAASGTSDTNISTGTGGGTKRVTVGNADGLTALTLYGPLAVNASVNQNVAFLGGTSTGTFAVGNAAAGAVTVDTAANISLDSATASNFTVTGAADLSLISTAGSVVINGGEAVADAIQLTSANGGLAASLADDIDVGNSAGNVALHSDAGTVLIDSAGVLELNSSAGVIGIGNDAVAQNINIGTGAAARAITVGNNSGATSVDVVTGTGGFVLTSGGLVDIETATDTQASPTAASTLNVNFGAATFTGFTTAAGATQDFTITNSLVSTSSPIGVWCANEGANDAQLTVTRVNRAAGSFVVTVTNNGAAALNGNVTITFLVGG